MSVNLMEAHNQWMRRPADQRFWGLADLLEAMLDQKNNSREYERKAGTVQAVAYTPPGYDQPDLMITAGQTPATLTNFGFQQLCRYVDAPPSYLSTLPPELAASCINNGMRRYKDDNVNLYVYQDKANKQVVLKSFLTDHYNRLYNADIIANGLKRAVEYGFVVPPARPAFHDPRARPATAEDIIPGQENFGLSVKIGDQIAPAGVYASDRDMFVAMCNPTRIIDTGGGGLMRGFFLSNSEVGARAFKLTTFLFETVCSNHIFWGASEVRELRVVHKGRAIDGVADKVRLTMKQISNAGESNEKKMVTAARSYVLGKTKTEVVEWLFNNKKVGLSKGEAELTYEYAEKWEHTALSSPNTAWGVCHALTRMSQTKQHMDERTRLDNVAGKLLQLVYKP